jgi:hypothetical protein
MELAMFDAFSLICKSIPRKGLYQASNLDAHSIHEDSIGTVLQSLCAKRFWSFARIAVGTHQTMPTYGKRTCWRFPQSPNTTEGIKHTAQLARLTCQVLHLCQSFTSTWPSAIRVFKDGSSVGRTSFREAVGGSWPALKSCWLLTTIPSLHAVHAFLTWK